jgi:hypothetical protein
VAEKAYEQFVFWKLLLIAVQPLVKRGIVLSNAMDVTGFPALTKLNSTADLH